MDAIQTAMQLEAGGKTALTLELQNLSHELQEGRAVLQTVQVHLYCFS